jgi:ankyrin repeat protein
MKNESKEEMLLKLIKSRKVNINDIINYVKTNIIDYDKLDSNGYNLLHYAIKSEHPEIVGVLLNPSYSPESFIANPNTITSDLKDNIFLPPMLLALNTNNDSSSAYKIFKHLYKAGGDYSLKDEEDCNIFHRACEKGRLDILDYLFSQDCVPNINLLSKHGSGLHLAVIGDQEDTVNFLLERGIDIELKDNNGNTSLHLAIQLKMFNAFKMISDHLVKIPDVTVEKKKIIYNAINEEGNTILHELAYAKSSVLIGYLTKMSPEYKVDENAKNKQGYDYKGVQENIIKLEKEREEMDKQRKELIRKEKERLIEEQKKEIESMKEEMMREALAEQRRKEMGEKMLKYRTHIFLSVFGILMVILYFALSSATKKKERII